MSRLPSPRMSPVDTDPTAAALQAPAGSALASSSGFTSPASSPAFSPAFSLRPPAEADAASASAAETLLAALQQRLQALGQAVRERDLDAMMRHAEALPADLAAATSAVGASPQPAEVAQRLHQASHQLLRERERLARAASVVDHALGMVWDEPVAGDSARSAEVTYGPQGRRLPRRRGPLQQA